MHSLGLIRVTQEQACHGAHSEMFAALNTTAAAFFPTLSGSWQRSEN